MSKLFILTFFTICLFGSCNFNDGKKVKGNNNRTSQQRTVSSFTGIEFVGDMNVFYTSGSNFSITVEGDENLLEYIETTVSGNTLNISTRKHFNLQSSSPIKVYITAPTLDDISMVGGGDFVTQSPIVSNNNLKIEAVGNGNLKAAIDAPQIKIEITGNGDLQLSGKTKIFDAEIMGSGGIKCFELLSEQTKIGISGSGDAQVYASKQLDVEINGSGSVAYKGSPAVSQNVSGSGSVRKAE